MSIPELGESPTALFGGYPVQYHGHSPVLENLGAIVDLQRVPSTAQPAAPSQEFAFLKSGPNPTGM